MRALCVRGFLEQQFLGLAVERRDALGEPLLNVAPGRCPARRRGADRRSARAPRPRPRRTARCVRLRASAAVSISAHRASRSNSRSATTNIAAMSDSASPSSSASSNGWSTPSRLTMRLASLVATISPRSRCWSIALANFLRIAGGKAAWRSSLHRVAGRERRMLDRVLQRELGGREQHRQFGPGQAAVLGAAAQQFVVAASPSTARSSRPDSSKISITRT